MHSTPIRWLSLFGLAAAMILPVISSLDAQVRKDDLVIWFDFDELDGTTVPDSAGTGFVGATAGGPGLEDGKFGKALKFNGDGQKVTVGYDAKLDVPKYTAAIWLKSVKSNDGWVGVFGRPGRHYNFWAGNSQTDNFFVHHRYRDGGNTSVGPGDARSFPHGEWTHVVLTNDGNTSATYVNGEKKTTGNVGNLTYTTNPLYIGANLDNGNGNWFEGLIDDFRLYGVAFSDAEVAKAYSDGNGDFDEPPVVTPIGDAYVRVPIGGTYTEDGATVTDPEDGDLDTIQTTYKGPQFAPPELAADTYEGLKLWLKADVEASGDTWVDQSGNDNNATRNGSPTIVEDALNGLPVMRYSGTNGEYHNFPNMTDVRTVFWVVNRNTGKNSFLLGDNNAYHFHTENNRFWHGSHAHANNRSGVLAVNGNRVNGLSDNVPTEMSVISLRTTGNVEASNFSNDRNIDNRYWSGDLAELLIYNTALTDEQTADVERRLGYKWGLQDDLPPVLSDAIDTSALGDWTVTYTATDSFGNTASAERQVRIFDPLAPVITLNGDAVVTHEQGSEYNDPGATVADADGNALDPAGIKVSGVVVGGGAGIYVLTYNFTDAQDRPAETVQRTVTVVDTIAPVLTLVGGAEVNHLLGNPYHDPTTVTDAGDATVQILTQATDVAVLYAFDDPDNPTINIAGDGDYKGVFIDGATWDPEGKSGGAMSLANGGNARMEAGPIDLGDEWTFATYFKELYPSGWRTLTRGQAGDHQLIIQHNATNLGLFDNAGGKGFQGTGFNMAAPDYQGWHHITAVGADGKTRYFVDGEHVGSVNIQSKTDIWRIGAWPGQRFARLIDDFRVYNRALSDLEVFNLCNVGIPDNAAPGTYTITYNAVDAAGNKAEPVTRNITVFDAVDVPVITLLGDPVMEVAVGSVFTEPGYTVKTAFGDDLDASRVVVTGTVDTGVPGENLLSYNFTSVEGLPGEEVIRTVHVLDLEAPVITLNGDAEVTIELGGVYEDAGATVEDNVDENLVLASSASFPAEGLILHLDAGSLSLKDGDPVTLWPDLSGAGNHADLVEGEPTWSATGLNGRPAIKVDGEDLVTTTTAFTNRYSIFTVSRLSGHQDFRLISSRTDNWLLGYWNGYENVMHANGWATDRKDLATPEPHLYSALNNADNHAFFYADTHDAAQYHNANGRIGQLQFGGWQAGNERGTGYISEVLLYDRLVNEQERVNIEAFLNARYGLNGLDARAPDTSTPGEYAVMYTVRDSVGNVATATRKVIVTEDTGLPLITLNGESRLLHEVGTEFTDPGVKVTTRGGDELDPVGLVVDNAVNVSVLGSYIIRYNFSDAASRPAEPVERIVQVVDMLGPVITITGESIVRIEVGADYQDEGATASDAHDGAVNVDAKSSNPSVQAQPGLLGGGLNGNMSLAPNPGDLGIDRLGPSLSESAAKPPWRDNYTVVYTGQIFDADGRISFMENIDDKAWLTVNGQKLLDNQAWNQVSEKSVDFGEGGWFDFELRMSNGGGGAGKVGNLGFGYDPEGGSNYVAPRNSDADSMDLFRVAAFDYSLLDTSVAGTYNFTYTATDSSGNTTTAVRTIVVSEDLARPSIILNGDPVMRIPVGSVFEDPGAKLTDAVGAVEVEGTVNVEALGEYSLTYTYTSPEGQSADPVSRKVHVIDEVPPVIVLKEHPVHGGTDTVKLLLGQEWVDPGFELEDNVAGQIRMAWAPSGILAYYAFDDPLDPVKDTMGVTGHHGSTQSGAMIVEEGRYGRGLYIPQEANATVDLGGNEVDIGEEWSAAAWFKGLYPLGAWRTLYRGSQLDHQVIVHPDNHQLGIYANGRGNFVTSGFRLIPENYTGWHHIATVAKEGRTLFFIDGQYVGDSAVSSNSQITRIGNWGASQHFASHLDEVYIFDRALGDDEVNALQYSGGTIDITRAGTYRATYFAEDASGNRSSAIRTVIVETDPTAGILALLGEPEVTHEAGTPYVDAGATLTDASGNSLPPVLILVEGLPEGAPKADFTITYNYTSPNGTVSGGLVRTVRVVDTTPPAITLIGNNPLILATGTEFIDPGATGSDLADGQVHVFRLGQVPQVGLVLHLDAGNIEGLNDGDVVFDWPDASPVGNNAENVKDDPTWHADGLNGKPVVRFDGGDLVWTSTDFGYVKEYTIVTVARYTGGDNERVISTRGPNWLFGFHGNSVRRFYANGWIWNQGGADTSWHLHAGAIRSDARADFWLDLNQLASNKTGANASAYQPSVIQLGGRNDNNELSKCEVAEVLFYERSLSGQELQSLQGFLDAKYGLGFGDGEAFREVDVDTPGIYRLKYTAMDAAGNLAEAHRKVVVEDGADLPFITLIGDEEMTIEGGVEFTDPGATLEDPDGNPLDASKIQVTGQVKVNQPGEYQLAYDYLSDDHKRAFTVIRKVIVEDTLGPVITLLGGETLRIPVGGEFSDPGVTVVDVVDGEVGFSTNLVRQNHILHQGFVQGWHDMHLFLDGNGGLLKSTPTGETVLAGPISFNGDASFQNAGAGIDRNDQYQNLFLSTFNAKVDGIYEFAITDRDDWAVLWLDLDRDGIFEKNGDMGDEWLNNGVVPGGRIVYLQKGYYRLAVGHMEGGGGSRLKAAFRTPEGAGPAKLSVIDPTEAAQDGLWLEVGGLDSGAPGEHVIEYTAVDSHGNETKVSRTVIFESIEDAPLLFLNGDRTMKIAAGSEFIDPGATVEDREGNPLDATKISATGSVDTARPGTYTLKYNFVGADGVSAKMVRRKVTVTDIVPPELTLNGEAEMTVFIGSAWQDPGATATDNVDGNLAVMSSETIPTIGLAMHLDAGRIPSVEDGGLIKSWPDISGSGSHLNDVIGAGRFTASDIGGRPAVFLDGQTYMATSKTFSNRYTVATVARLDGTLNRRLVSSRNQNWLHGFHNNHINCFHAAGWATHTVDWEFADTKPHLNISRSDTMKVRFWGDGVDKTIIPDRAGRHIGQFQLGGYQTGNESSAGYVSEVLLYDRALADVEIEALHFHLNAKYGLQGADPVNGPVNTQALGDYEVLYATVDSSGNRVTAKRVVHVTLDPAAPVLTLLGESVVGHEGGTPYLDAGVALTDGAGEALDASLVEVTNPVDVNKTGEYTILYAYTDAEGRKAPGISRMVVVGDTMPPVITLVGDPILRLEVGSDFSDPGATAEDAVEGELTVDTNLEMPTVGILGFWNFNETEGDVANDLFNDNHGTLNNFNGSQWVAGKNGNALSFDGSNDSVNLPVSAHPTTEDTEVTIAFWSKGGSLLPRNTSILESEKGNNRVLNIHHPWSNQRIYWDVGNGGYDRIDKAATAAEYKGNWVHWAFTKDRTSGVQQIYRDGELWHSGSNKKRAWITPDLVRVGSGKDNNNFWHGLLDDLAIYNIVLTKKEISVLAAGRSDLDMNQPGTYTYQYSVTDSAGNKATAIRTVQVVDDISVPFIVLKGDSPMEHDAGAGFTDPGATVTDFDGVVMEEDIKGEGTVDVNVPGEYTITYNYTDADGGVADEIVRTVVVADTTGPVITLNAHPNGGVAEVKLLVGQAWEDPGAVAADAFDPEVVLLSRPEGAVAYYSFDNRENPTADDSTEGNKYDGTLVDGATWATDGKFGGALHLPINRGNARMEVGNIDINAEWTLSAHFKELYSGSWRTLFRGRHTDHQIIIENNATNLGSYMNQAGGFKGTGFHMAAGDYGDWHHIAAVGKDNKTRFFIDGKFVGQISFQSQSDIWRIGAWPGQRFSRLIDDVHVFQRALEDNEILGLLIEKSAVVDTSAVGTHVIKYSSVDDAGNLSTVSRTVIVEPDPAAPVLTLNGEASLVHEAGTPFTDPGAGATDEAGAVLAANVPADETLDVNLPGEQVLAYNFKDASDRPALTITRTVLVKDTLAPVITLRGADPVIVALGDVFEDPGATALDALEGELSVPSNLDLPMKGILGLWNFDETEGDVAGDSANENHGALSGFDGSQWVVGKYGNALSFDGQDDMVILPVSAHPAGEDTQMTIAFWSNGGSQLPKNTSVLESGLGGGRIVNIHHPWSNSRIYWDVGQSGHDRIEKGAAATDLKGKWVHWAFTKDRISGVQKIYKDGESWHTGGNLKRSWATPDRVHLGSNRDRGHFWHGLIDDLAIYNRVLSDGEIERLLQGVVTLDTSREGEQTITYTVSDEAGNESTMTRTVHVIDNPPIPEITLLPGDDGQFDLSVEAGTDFTEPGFTLVNRYGKAIDASAVKVDSNVDSTKLGTYLVTYNYTDDKNNPATQRKRIVNVVDTTPPVITLAGDNPLQFLVGNPFVDPGATAVDNLDGDVTVTMALKDQVEGLVARWSFDDGAGDKLSDFVGDIDGTLANFDDVAAAWVDGRFGKALEFDGIDDHVKLPASATLDLQAFTLSAWIRSADYNHNGFIFEKTTNGQVNTQFNLYLQNNDQLNFRLVSGGNLNDTFIPASENLKVEEWNHVAVSYDGLMKNIYVDGQLKTSMPAVVTVNTGGGGVSTIGAVSPGLDYFFNGLMDEIQVYDRAVPDEQIMNLMKPAGIDTSTKTVQPYVLVYTATDSSGNTGRQERTVVVSNDTVPPVITLEGPEVVNVGLGEFYDDEGATAFDEVDGNLTPFIDDGGTLDAIDTSQSGEYIITYNVEDFSGNAAEQVTRTVIVAAADPFSNWIVSVGLDGLPEADKAQDGDPDRDGIPNILEYALGGNPIKSDRIGTLPVFGVSGGSLTITYVRLKVSEDSSLSYTPQLSGNLADSSAWDDSLMTLKGALENVSQAQLPDGRAFGSSKYERIQATASIPIHAASTGKQFIRLVVDRE